MSAYDEIGRISDAASSLVTEFYNHNLIDDPTTLTDVANNSHKLAGLMDEMVANILNGSGGTELNPTVLIKRSLTLFSCRADSSFGGYPPSNAMDANASSSWCTANQLSVGATASWYCDFLMPVFVKTISINTSDEYGRLSNLSVYQKDTNDEYSLLASKDNGSLSANFRTTINDINTVMYGLKITSKMGQMGYPHINDVIITGKLMRIS